MSFLSKITESAAIQQLVRTNKFNKMTPIHQSTYKEFHSCETLLIKLVNDILWAMEHEDITLVCLDLSAAFDTIDHDILIKTLQNHFGVQSTALDCLKDFGDWMDQTRLKMNPSKTEIIAFGSRH